MLQTDFGRRRVWVWRDAVATSLLTAHSRKTRQSLRRNGTHHPSSRQNFTAEPAQSRSPVLHFLLPASRGCCCILADVIGTFEITALRPTESGLLMVGLSSSATSSCSNATGVDGW